MNDGKKIKSGFAGLGRYLPLLLVLAAIAAYAGSFSGSFLLDDEESIVLNPNIRLLRPITRVMSAAPRSAPSLRPVAYLTFAVNYAVGDLNVAGYHLVNLVIHILAGLTLFGIVRRTLLCERLRVNFGREATALAFLIALIWLIHPLQTASVTYIVQRIESLMGLFFLLTLYSAVRVLQGRRSVIFAALSVICCCLGMATKEVMVAAPFMVLAYDRTFFSGSFVSSIRRRPFFYIGLAATWAVLAVMMWLGPQTKSAGFSFGVSAVDYARTQSAVILHYLRLAFWPSGLCLDYAWPLAKSFSEVFVQMLVVAAMLGVLILGFVRNYTWSYPLLWFFAILAPTSSFVPLADLAFEHRMYLPLAGIITTVILWAYLVLGRIDELFEVKVKTTGKLIKLKGIIGCGAGVLVILTLTGFTIMRNGDYQDEVVIWQKTLEQAPHNPRVHLNLGTALLQQNRVDEAISHYQTAVKLRPDYGKAHYNLANALLQYRKSIDEALYHYNMTLKLWPTNASANNHVGLILYHKGDIEQAVFYFRRSLEIEPDNYLVHHNLAVALAKQGRLDEAITHMEEAVRLKPDFSTGQQKLKRLLAHKAGLDSVGAGTKK